MRTNEPDPEPWQPLGERVKPAVSPPAPAWRDKPGSPGIEESRAGHLRTNLPLPKEKP